MATAIPSHGIPPSRSRQGFTLAETLVVIAILGVALGLLLPAVQLVRNAAAKAACASHLRQVALAAHLYSDSRSHLPKGCDYPFLRDARSRSQQSGLSWLTSILPYVEQEALWRQAWSAHVEDPVGYSRAHGVAMSQTVAAYVCPAESRRLGRLGNGSVLGADLLHGGGRNELRTGRRGFFHRDLLVRFADITDGTSTTLMIGERPAGPNGVFGGWYAAWGPLVCPLGQILSAGWRAGWQPSAGGGCPMESSFRAGRGENVCDLNHFWSLHTGGANFAFADSSVSFLRYERSGVLPLLATRADGEIVSGD